DGDQASGVPGQARAGPGVTPGVAGDELLELLVEGRAAGQRAVHMGVAQYRAAYLQAFFITLFLIHCACLVVAVHVRGRPARPSGRPDQCSWPYPAAVRSDLRSDAPWPWAGHAAPRPDDGPAPLLCGSTVPAGGG